MTLTEYLGTKYADNLLPDATEKKEKMLIQ